jgi:hypothetical protein
MTAIESRRKDPFDLTGDDFHNVADGPRDSGDWRVERRVVPENKYWFLGGVQTPPGTYTGLLNKGAVWMSDVPDEKDQHRDAYYAAKRLGGRCLVHGLGLGMVVRAMAELPNVEHIDVVELEEDVIKLCGPAFEPYGDRITIHHDNALTRRWPIGTRWQVVWHDVWRDISEENLPEMAKLNRSYGQRADWQGCWSQEELKALKRSWGY